MYIAQVAPISKGVGKEQLTYFTSKKIPVGSIVVVPLRNKKVDALVLKIEDARNFKTSLKSSSFTTKKIDSIKSKNALLPEFIYAVRETAEYFAGTTGSILNTLAKTALSEIPKPAHDKKDSQKQKVSQDIKQDISLVQAENTDRMSTYKGIIREEFAKGSSVFFCLPEISEIEETANILQKGIEKYTFVFHSKISKKEISKNWENILKEQHPVLIIATGHYLSIPRNDFGIIIVDRENNDTYKMMTRPFVDIRIFVKFLAKNYKSRLIFGDILLRTETIYQKEKGFYSEYSPLKFRYLSTAENKIVNMKPDEETLGKKKDVYVSDELKNIIENTKKNNENTFILVSRKGLHTLIICNDCGETMVCNKCNTPITLHSSSSFKKDTKINNLFICNNCKVRKSAQDKCASCGSWRLAMLGAGIDKVEELIKERFIDIETFRTDSKSTKTQKKIIDTINKFYETPGSILLGTEMAIPYLNKNITNVIIFSIDSLFAIPDFKIEEHMFRTLLQLRTKASNNFLIQTRDIDKKIFEFAAKGNLIDFYREEVSIRNELKYPPFSILIKISLSGTKTTATKEIEKLSKILEEYKPNIFPSAVSKPKEKYKLNILLKIPSDNWIDKKLVEILQSLPMSFTVDVETGSII
jgi:primosomal protein N' (replication factor Y)